MILVGHLSDLHTTPVRPERLADLLGKRFLGWASYQLKRRHRHRPDVLEALIEDLRGADPHHVVVTGDLTNVALEAEFPAARAWLARLGGPDRVSLVPGNHDAYVHVPRAASWDHWTDYLASDDEAPRAGDDSHDAGFPTLRVRGGAAFIGLCSALPTGLLEATGRLGEGQLERLEKLLAGLADSPLCRIVLVHHPVTHGAVSPRRGLVDGGALREVLRRTGADLVLHGHAHRELFESTDGPAGPIPVVGVRSSSDFGQRPHKRAQYHLYEIERAPDHAPARFRVTVRVRGYDPQGGAFVPEGERVL